MALVFVVAPADGRDVAVRGVADYLVHGAAILYGVGVVLAVHVERLAREQELRLVYLARDPSQPPALLAVDRAAHSGVYANDEQRARIYGEVGRALARPAAFLVAPACRKLSLASPRRPAPEQPSQPLLQRRGPSLRGREGRHFGPAQMVHETDQAVVPVVVARKGVDGASVAVVGFVELGFVVL